LAIRLFPCPDGKTTQQFAAHNICALHATPDLLTEHAMLGYQRCMASSQLFVNRRSDGLQQFLLVHTFLTPAKTAYMEEQYGRKSNEFQVEACIMVEV
jgi:hypothetical protein